MNVSVLMSRDVHHISTLTSRHVSVNAMMILFANHLSIWTLIHVSVNVLNLNRSVLDSKYAIRTLVSVNVHHTNVPLYKVWTISCASVTVHGGQSGTAAKLQNTMMTMILNLKSHHTSQAGWNLMINLAIEMRHQRTEEKHYDYILNNPSQVYRFIPVFPLSLM